MDKQISDLDPKLKEIYERVMNTSISSAQLTQAATTPPPQPAQQQPAPQPAVAQQPAAQSQAIPQAPESAFISSLSNVATTEAPPSHGMSPILIAIFAVVFVSVYTLIWIKLFHLQIPVNIPFINP